MKTFTQLSQEVGYSLTETASTRVKSKTGEWKIQSFKETDYATLIGTNEKVDAEIRIKISFSKFIVDATIKDKEGNVVGRLSISDLRQYKKFPPKWKKEVGHLIKAPSDSLMFDALTKIHSVNAKNSFHEYNMVN